MKRLITIASLFIVLTSHAQQRVTKTADGNFIVAQRDTTGTNKATGQTITDKDGVKHPVMISRNGKLFYMRVSKAGNIYKSYIKTE